VLFRNKVTAIPRWIANKWELEKYFPDVDGRSSQKDSSANTKIIFQKNDYNGFITSTFPKNRANKVHRLWFEDELIQQLKNVFVMSYMRDIESGLRGNVGDIEKEIPFWEFLDIEFNPIKEHFILTAHYKQEPTFPELFKNLAESPALKIIEDEILNKKEFRIHKQNWKTKDKLETEIGALNAIYTLLDKKNKLIYIGEAKDLRKRLKQRYPSIPNWTHYRYDALPKHVTQEVRVQIERMIIRSYASLLKSKSKVKSIEISNYKLTNDRIDK
tara:strand:+ start:210 stop:1025 length:816 start_codon:yes stop_codon:yes gene_type:complete